MNKSDSGVQMISVSEESRPKSWEGVREGVGGELQ